MATTNTLNTRIQLKYDSLANWTNNNPKLLPGELAIVKIDGKVSGTATINGSDLKEPTLLFKVGNESEANFNDLPWTSALAADVHDWAKLSYADFLVELEKTFYTETEVNALIEAAKTAVTTAAAADAKTKADAAETNAKSHAETKATEALTAAKKYTDEEITKIVTGSGYATTKYVEDAVKVETDRATEAESKLSGRIGVLEAIDHDAYIAADTALKTELQGYADGKAGAAETAAKSHSDANLATAKTYAEEKASAAETNAKSHADSKANTAEANAKLYADGLLETAKGYSDTNLATAKSYADGVAATAKSEAIAAAKTETETQISAVVSQYLTGEGAAETIDTLQEIVTWLNTEGAGAEKIVADVAQNAKDIEAIETSLTAEGTVGKAIAEAKQAGLDAQNSVTTLAGEVYKKSEVYTKAEADAEFMNSTETGSAIDAKIAALDLANTYQAKGEYYTKSEADAAFMDSTETDSAIDAKIAALKLSETYQPVGNYKTVQEVVAETGAADKTLKISQDANGVITATPVAIAIAQSQVSGLADALAAKANDADLAAIAKSGNVNDLVQTAGDVLVFNCGSSSLVF